MRILVVEDAVTLREAVVGRLRALGHGVDEAGALGDAEVLLRCHDYDLVVLDRMLPDGDGVDRLRRWRNNQRLTPVLVLTARDAVADRVGGLEAGADDYLVKPFDMAELVARVRALSRRGPIERHVVRRVSDLELDTARAQVRRGGVLLPLRPKELAVLELLMRNAGCVVSRDRIREACWDEAHEPGSNVEEVVISALRRKLGTPSLIRTRRGLGYVIDG
jgi:two-component system copper resistance phosphate regulon response regulator CusR